MRAVVDLAMSLDNEAGKYHMKKCGSLPSFGRSIQDQNR